MIQKNTLWLFALVALASIAFGQTALADGGIFYPTDRYSNETNQKAFIYYHNQTENLIVQSGFRGNASDFAWVIPTPSKPEVLASKTGLFTTLESLTSTSNDGPDVVYSTATLGLSGAAPKSSVTVVEQKTVDVFDTAVLQATPPAP